MGLNPLTLYSKPQNLTPPAGHPGAQLPGNLGGSARCRRQAPTAFWGLLQCQARLCRAYDGTQAWAPAALWLPLCGQACITRADPAEHFACASCGCAGTATRSTAAAGCTSPPCSSRGPPGTTTLQARALCHLQQWVPRWLLAIAHKASRARCMRVRCASQLAEEWASLGSVPHTTLWPRVWRGRGAQDLAL